MGDQKLDVTAVFNIKDSTTNPGYSDKITLSYKMFMIGTKQENEKNLVSFNIIFVA